MTWARFMFVFLAVLSLSQTVALFVDRHTNFLILALHLVPTIALWLGYGYRYIPTVRIYVVRFLSFFGHQRTSIRVTARFKIIDQLSIEEVVEAIRTRYGSSQAKSVKAFQGDGRTIVEMPGWQARIQFSSPSFEENLYSHSGESSFGDLLITMPDTQNAIESARTLLESDILPLFETLTQSLPLTLEATEVTIRFLEPPNPYLAAYLQNVDLERITSLKCVIQEAQPHAQAVISRDKVSLQSTNLADMRNLAQKHLALQWSLR